MAESHSASEPLTIALTKQKFSSIHCPSVLIQTFLLHLFFRFWFISWVYYCIRAFSKKSSFFAPGMMQATIASHPTQLRRKKEEKRREVNKLEVPDWKQTCLFKHFACKIIKYYYILLFKKNCLVLVLPFWKYREEESEEEQLVPKRFSLEWKGGRKKKREAVRQSKNFVRSCYNHRWLLLYYSQLQFIPVPTKVYQCICYVLYCIAKKKLQ